MSGRVKETLIKRVLIFGSGLLFLYFILKILGFSPLLPPFIVGWALLPLYLIPRLGVGRLILDLIIVNLIVYAGGGIKGFLLWFYPMFIFHWMRRGENYGTLFGFLSGFSIILIGLLDLTPISPYFSLFGERLKISDLYLSFTLGIGMVIVATGVMRLLSERTLHGRVKERTRRLERGYFEIVRMLAKILEERDPYTLGHSERVSELSVKIAKEMGLRGKILEILKNAGLLHDIGKIGVRDSVLLKKGPLTEEEWEEIKAHPKMGADILRSSGFLEELIPLIEEHHERWDGKGYPKGLKGEEIDLGARILAVADAFDALTSDRAYRKRFPPDEAIRILKEGAGVQWDPKVVDALIRVLEKEPEIIAQIEERVSLNI